MAGESAFGVSPETRLGDVVGDCLTCFLLVAITRTSKWHLSKPPAVPPCCLGQALLFIFASAPRRSCPFVMAPKSESSYL